MSMKPKHLQLCTQLTFVHESGDRLHPFAKKNRQTGDIAWVVAKPEQGNNTTSADIRIWDEAVLVEYVVERNYSVWCRTPDGSRHGLYSRYGHSTVFKYEPEEI